MAYMNDVNSVANAFKGNPQALEQRYAQDQQLIDLLALQKIKSDMEAAKRDMMMKSAQQGQQPTVKQQREQEVLDMTKQDVAQRVAGVAQQQQQEEQQRMQQMLQSGLAQAPAPNMANFAGGGIVAFAGPEGSYVKDKEEEDEESFMERIFGDRKRPMPLYREGREKLTKEEIEEAKRLKEMGLLDAIKYSGRRVLDALPLGQGTPLRKMVGEESKPETAAPQPDNRALLNRADAALRSQPGTPPPAPAAPPPAAAPAPRPQAAAAAPGLPALPPAGAPAAPGADQGIGSLQSAVQGRITQDVGRNAAAERLAEENRIRQLYAGTQLSPEEQRQRRLKQFLLGAANRSGIGSVMAGGLAGSLREQDVQRAEQQELLGKSIGAGQKSFEQAEMSSRQGVASGSEIVNRTLDRAFQERKLLSDRDVAILQDRTRRAEIAATNAIREAQMEANNIAKQDSALRAINQSIATTTEKIAARYQQEINNAQLGLQAAKTDKERKEAQAAIDAIRRKAEAEAERATFDLREQANGIRDRQMASSGLGNFKVEKIK
jgi:hypothetical protein